MTWFFFVPTAYFFLTNIKNVFWVLKRTVSLIRFFWVPTTYVWMRVKCRKWFSNGRSYLEAWINYSVLYTADKVCSPLIDLIFWSICALSRFRLSPKSLETMQPSWWSGSLEPLLSHLFEFHQFLPLDRSQKGISYLYAHIIYFNNRKYTCTQSFTLCVGKIALLANVWYVKIECRL